MTWLIALTFIKTHWRVLVAVVVLLLAIFALYQQFTSEPKVEINEPRLQQTHERIAEQGKTEFNAVRDKSNERLQGINSNIKQAENATKEQTKPNHNNATAQEIERLAREK